jgi:hypothetical protein
MSNNNAKASPISGEFTDNDVLCGRGGSINSHPGNEAYRKLVEKRKRVYLTARFKREKRLIANSIVSEIRNQDPPGRFLSKNPATGKWEDIGDEKARDKTSQALRENAPTIRAEIETEINEQRQADMSQENAAAHANAPMAAGAPPPPGYYGQWGYYGSFYGGWGPVPPQGPPTGAYPPGPGYPGQWPQSPYGQQAPGQENQMQPPPPRTDSNRQSRPNKRPPPSIQPAKSEESKASAFDSLPSFVASWTRGSFSFADPSADHHDDNVSTTSSRRVSFKEDSIKRGRSSEPMDLGHPSEAQEGSLLTQVANHILGSWDPTGVACTMNPEGSVNDQEQQVVAPREGQDIGQEVELVEDIAMDYDMAAEDDIREESATMPPPAEMDWASRVGSCHTWLPEASSFFSMGGNNALSPTASLEMDQSAAGVSLGGNSLRDVFKEEDAQQSIGQVYSEDLMASPRPSMNARVLNQIPSWERSFRSHSPSTVASDSSFLSKANERGLSGGLTPRTLSPRNSMEWDQPKVRE